MSQLTGARIANALLGLLSGLDSTDRAYLKRILGLRQKVTGRFTDGGATATAVGTSNIWHNDTGLSVRVDLAEIILPVTVAPGATDNAAFTLSKVDADGANAATVATYTSDVAGGTATASKPKAMTLVGGTSTVCTIADGWTLRIAATKGGSGVPVASATAQGIVEVSYDFDV